MFTLQNKASAVLFTKYKSNLLRFELALQLEVISNEIALIKQTTK